MSTNGFSRRQFIKGAAAGSVGIAASGLLAGCAGGKPTVVTPEPNAAAAGNTYPSCEDLSAVNGAKNKGEIAFVSEPITEFVKTEQVDVLVCGQGPSGMAAALSCAEHGLKVAAVEKGEAPTYRSPTMGGFKDRIHQKFGVEFDMKQWMDDAMVNSCYRGSQAIYQKLIDTSDEAVNWFLDQLGQPDEAYFLTFNAGDFKDFNAPYDELSLSRSWNTSINLPMAPKDAAAILQQKLADAGVTVQFSTPVVQLIKAEGKVTGAVVKTADGYVKYETAKGVVIATGGYEYNPDKLNACCRPRDLALSGWMNATMTNTGDGHEMAKAVGAMEDEYPHPLMLDPQQLMPFLRVNKLGKRFTPEYEAYNHLSNAIQSQPGAYDFYIVDGNCAAIVDSIWTPSSGCYAPKEVWIGAATSDNALKADTLEELAKLMGVDEAVFVETINRWNEMCDAGEDTDFHFPGKMMHKIDTAPFYANKEMAEALCTAGGLQITPNSEVLDQTGNPIPGLYAIGNASGSMFSGTYPHNQNCLSHSRCITFGYNIGKTLSA